MHHHFDIRNYFMPTTNLQS